MRQVFTLQLLFSTIRLSTPLVLAALGGLYSERSGVINIALEGLLLSGAFTAASVTYYAGSSAAPWLPAGYTQYSPWVGLAAAILAGALVAYIIALACIRFKADQVVTGTGINILFIGMPAVSIGQSSLFTRNMAAGRGFIALAALIFGKWRPTQTMLACLLFGFADALTIQMQGVVKLPWNPAEDIPVQFIQMIPYVVTIVVLAGFIGQSRAPRALGTAYEKER